VKLLLDMNLSPRWTEALKAAGIASAHWSSIGRHDASDAEILHYAAAHGYVVVTHDLDFSEILAASEGAVPSVVQIRAADISPERIGPALISMLRQLQDELERGALIAFEPHRHRVRLLPLTPRG